MLNPPSPFKSDVIYGRRLIINTASKILQVYVKTYRPIHSHTIFHVMMTSWWWFFYDDDVVDKFHDEKNWFFTIFHTKCLFSVGYISGTWCRWSKRLSSSRYPISFHSYWRFFIMEMESIQSQFEINKGTEPAIGFVTSHEKCLYHERLGDSGTT